MSNTITTYKLKEIEAEDYKRDEMTPKQILREQWIMYDLNMGPMPTEPHPDIEVITEVKDD